MIGIVDLVRSAVMTAVPSMSGSPRSRTTRSGRSTAAAIASRPVSAVATV
jgi:hypothetical protein